jgi:four helix bundle protein
MGRDYQNIVAWERSHRLTLSVYQLTKIFPRDERFALVNQLRRAAYSVPANIAEGSARDSKRDYLRFLFIALGSLKETEYFLFLARDLGYLSNEDFQQATEGVNAAFSALFGLIKAVQKEISLFGRTWMFLAAFAPILAACHAFNPS